MRELKKIVVAADSFKGSATSVQIARAAAEGIHSVWPGCEVVGVPVGDGGEDTVEAIVTATQGRWIECRVHGPLHGYVDARYGLLPDGTAAIELAAAAGLPLVAQEERDPSLTTTFGVGQMIADAIGRGCRDILLCIGGSATNDAGTGLLAALGYRFLDTGGHEVTPCGASLSLIERIDDANVAEEVKACHFTVACDVRNPFYGPDGAAHVFAPQKGADAEMTEMLDNGLHRFADVIRLATGTDISAVQGAGAAGGVGGALMALLGARLRPGIEMVLDAIGFDRVIEDADMVITGEGRIDTQTAMGKTAYGVMLRSRRRGIPVIAIGGAVTETDALNRAGFTAVLPLPPYPVTLEEAMDPEFTMANVRRTIGQIARIIGAF